MDLQVTQGPSGSAAIDALVLLPSVIAMTPALLFTLQCTSTILYDRLSQPGSCRCLEVNFCKNSTKHALDLGMWLSKRVLQSLELQVVDGASHPVASCINMGLLMLPVGPLTSLVIGNVELQPAVFTAPGLSGLKELVLNGTGSLSLLHLSSLTHLTSLTVGQLISPLEAAELKERELYGSLSQQEESPRSMGGVALCQLPTSLQRLHAAHLIDVFGGQYGDPLVGLTNLTSLTYNPQGGRYAAGCGGDSEAPPKLPVAPGLVELDLRDCQGLPCVLEFIASHLTAVTQLALSCPDGTAPQLVTHMLDRLRGLKELYLAAYTPMDVSPAKGLPADIICHAASLEKVHLVDARFDHLSSLTQLSKLSSLTQLKRLCIQQTGRTGYCAQRVAAVLPALPGLLELDVRESSTVHHSLLGLRASPIGRGHNGGVAKCLDLLLVPDGGICAAPSLQLLKLPCWWVRSLKLPNWWAGTAVAGASWHGVDFRGVGGFLVGAKQEDLLLASDAKEEDVLLAFQSKRPAVQFCLVDS